MAATVFVAVLILWSQVVVVCICDAPSAIGTGAAAGSIIVRRWRPASGRAGSPWACGGRRPGRCCFRDPARAASDGVVSSRERSGSLRLGTEWPRSSMAIVVRLDLELGAAAPSVGEFAERIVLTPAKSRSEERPRQAVFSTLEAMCRCSTASPVTCSSGVDVGQRAPTTAAPLPAADGCPPARIADVAGHLGRTKPVLDRVARAMSTAVLARRRWARPRPRRSGPLRTAPGDDRRRAWCGTRSLRSG